MTGIEAPKDNKVQVAVTALGLVAAAIGVLAIAVAANSDHSSSEQTNLCPLSLVYEAKTEGYATYYDYYMAQPPSWQQAYASTIGCVE